MRKGQIIGQVFVLILAAIVFILILTYGYRAIQNIRERSQEVAFIDVTTTLKTEVSSISLSYGSVKKLELSGLPLRYKEICFVTGMEKGQQFEAGNTNTGDLEDLKKLYPLIYELYEPGNDAQNPGGEANVFFVPSAPKNIKLDHIQASRENGRQSAVRWFCAPVDEGTVTLRLEGLGNAVRISQWLT